eukprot:m.1141517 g.1141517  ORF g.1141517 m.1141517 type:complete len:710 (+) comp24449_c0_seq27:317-2446(+)
MLHSSRQISAQSGLQKGPIKFTVPDDTVELGPQFANLKVQELFSRWLSNSSVWRSIEASFLELKTGTWTPHLHHDDDDSDHGMSPAPLGEHRRSPSGSPKDLLARMRISSAKSGSPKNSPGLARSAVRSPDFVTTRSDRASRGRSPLSSADISMTSLLTGEIPYNTSPVPQDHGREQGLLTDIPVEPTNTAGAAIGTSATLGRAIDDMENQLDTKFRSPHAESSATTACAEETPSMVCKFTASVVGKRIPNLASLLTASGSNVFNPTEHHAEVVAVLQDGSRPLSNLSPAQASPNKNISTDDGFKSPTPQLSRQLSLDGCMHVCSASNLPRYFAAALFRASGGWPGGLVQADAVWAVWQQVIAAAPSVHVALASLLVRPRQDRARPARATVAIPVLSPTELALHPDDFRPLVEHVLQTHEGLAFLVNDDGGFGPRYVDTVISRLYHATGRCGRWELSANDLRRCGFVETLWELEHAGTDVNDVLRFWSYEHFYVIYTLYWKMDDSGDGLDRAALQRLTDDGIAARALDRIMAWSAMSTSARARCAVGHAPDDVDNVARMDYPTFVLFLLSEEDKHHRTSVAFWFHCLDLDDDGKITPYEIEQFYVEQKARLQQMGVDSLALPDFLCQVLDMVKPAQPPVFTLTELQTCGHAKTVINMLVNAHKFLEHEERDAHQDLADRQADTRALSDWERFAEISYAELSAEAEDEED